MVCRDRRALLVKYKSEKIVSRDKVAVKKEIHQDDDVNHDELKVVIDLEEEISSQEEFERILRQSKNTHFTHESTLYRYYYEVGKYPLLTATEEKECGLAVKLGDMNAWRRLFKGNLRLVIMLAQRYQNQGVDLQDLISEGNLGVMHAISKFEPEKGFRFSTYAVWWIRHYLSNVIMNNGRTIRVPIHINKAIARLLATKKTLSQNLKREPTISEMAIETGQSISEVMRLLANHESTLSLDAAISKDQNGGDFYHIVTDDNAEDATQCLISSEKLDILKLTLDRLTHQERKVIECRFGINGKSKKTLERTGEVLGLTRDQVRYSQMKALDTLKSIFEERGIELQDILTE